MREDMLSLPYTASYYGQLQICFPRKVFLLFMWKQKRCD